MIKYSLKCTQGHAFESWFASAEAYDKLEHAGHVTCVVCGSDEVAKAIMAPNVSAKSPPLEPAPAVNRPLSAPAHPAEQALAEIKEKIEKNSEYVGPQFVSEARAMHTGDAPERSIYGEASLQEAKKLMEDGVPVAPLPFVPNRKNN